MIAPLLGSFRIERAIAEHFSSFSFVPLGSDARSTSLAGNRWKAGDQVFGIPISSSTGEMVPSCPIIAGQATSRFALQRIMQYADPKVRAKADLYDAI